MKQYRLTLERPGLHGPHAFFHTDTKSVALSHMQREQKRYAKWEPRTIVGIQSRECSEWVPELEQSAAQPPEGRAA